MDLRQKSAAGQHQWEVQVEGEATPRTFDAVLVTLPAWMISKLLQSETFSGLRQSLDQLEYASSAIVVSTHRLEDFEHPLDAFGLVIPDRESRKILAVSFSSRKFAGRAPDGWIVLRTFVGGAMSARFVQSNGLRDSGERLEGAHFDPGNETPSGNAEVARYARSMPQYHVGHLDRVKAIEQAVLPFYGLAVCGSSFYGVGIPDSISSGVRKPTEFCGNLKILPQQKLNSVDS